MHNHIFPSELLEDVATARAYASRKAMEWCFLCGTKLSHNSWETAYNELMPSKTDRSLKCASGNNGTVSVWLFDEKYYIQYKILTSNGEKIFYEGRVD